VGALVVVLWLLVREQARAPRRARTGRVRREESACAACSVSPESSERLCEYSMYIEQVPATRWLVWCWFAGICWFAK
jgi:hypothetical protein